MNFAPQSCGKGRKYVICGWRAFFSGIAAHDVSGDIRAQTREVLDILDQRLVEAGSKRSQLLTVHIWLSDMALFRDMTDVWNDWAEAAHPPSRSCVSGRPSNPSALLEVVATAAVPDEQGTGPCIERFGMVHAPGSPTMCLGLGLGQWFTVCLLAPDNRADIAGQTHQILNLFDDYLAKAGTDKTRLLTAEIWLKSINDIDTVGEIWSEWLGQSSFPAGNFVRADMARPEALLEIRVTASRVTGTASG